MGRTDGRTGMAMMSDLITYVLSNRAHFRLTGPDRVRFLHNFCTQNINDLPAGGGAEAFACNVKARIVGHFFVFVSEDDIRLEGFPHNRETIPPHFGKYLMLEDAELIDESENLSQILLCGEEAVELVAKEFAIEPLTQPHQHVEAEWQGEPVHLRRADWLGKPGCSIVANREVCERFVAESNLSIASEAEFEAARIAGLFPEFGVDLTDAHLVPEANRNQQAVNYTKGCYLGQEPIARIDALGHVNRRLCGLRWTGEPVPSGTAVMKPGTESVVGEVSSSVLRPDSDEAIGLAMIKSQIASGGNVDVNSVLAAVVG